MTAGATIPFFRILDFLPLELIGVVIFSSKYNRLKQAT